MPTLKIKHTDVDPANHPYNVLQRLKIRLQQKYNALRNKHPEERRAFRKIDKEIVKVNGSAKPLSQKDIHASRGVVSTVCHEMKNAKLGTTLFNIVIGMIGTGILLVVQTVCIKKIDNVIGKMMVDGLIPIPVYESKIRSVYNQIALSMDIKLTDEEIKWCKMPMYYHAVNIRAKCQNNPEYNDKMIGIVNKFNSITQNKKNKIKNGSGILLSDSQYKLILRLQRSMHKDCENGDLFTHAIDEDIVKVFSGSISFFVTVVLIGPVTEELFKFCSLRLTDKSLVPTATFGYCEMLMYLLQICRSGATIPLKAIQIFFRFFIAPWHIKTASKMKHAPVGQHYRTLGKQMFAHMKWNATSVISIIRLLINDFFKMYRGKAHTLKDTYQGVHLLLFGKTDKKIEAETRTHKRGKSLTRFRRTKRVQPPSNLLKSL